MLTYQPRFGPFVRCLVAGIALLSATLAMPVLGQNLATWSFGTTGVAASPVAANVLAPNAAYTNAAATTAVTSSRFTANQWTNASLDLAKYFEVRIDPATNYNMSVTQFTVNVENNNTTTITSGPANFEVRSSTDGFITSVTSLSTGVVTSTPTTITIPISSLVRSGAPVTIRVYFWGATDPARLIRLGSAAFNGTVQRPTLTLSTNSLSGFSTTQGVPSAAQSYVISGSALVSGATLTAPAGFEISTSPGSGFGGSLTLPGASGAIPNTTIYVRLTGVAQGTYSGAVTDAATSAITQNVTVSGVVQVAQPVGLVRL